MRNASGNGKVILFGEYSVLNGVTGYAVALKDFTLKVTLPDTLNTINLTALTNHAVIESNIPEGSGLGSSAALSVALARSLSKLNTTKNELFSLAKKFEDELHGGSSGIDTFTVLSGGLCSISSGGNFTKLSGTFLNRLRRFKFSLIDTKTKRSVRNVKLNIEKLDLEEYLPISREISIEFRNKLEEDQLKLSDMISLFNRSHSALVRLKVSTVLIDSIAEAFKKDFEMIGLKITGAGGGGCLLLVHDENVSERFILERLGVLNNENIKLWYGISFLD